MFFITWILLLSDIKEVVMEKHWLSMRDGYEYELIKSIVEVDSSKIARVPLHVADYPVGLESQVWKVNSLLDIGSDDGVHMVGIYGIGGIGKTTLARAVYNLIADQFEGLCFLDKVRENSMKHGIEHLQEMLLSKIVRLDIKLGDVSEGVSMIKHRLCRKKVLLVLDDVDDLKQLRAIAGGLDWFGSGSRVIITTRDKHLLINHRVQRAYEVEELNEEDALELLGWNAFKSGKVDPSYLDILNRVLIYVRGHPLALEVIGSNLFGKGIEEWKSALDQYKRIPNKEIQKTLQVSFDALEEYQQEIFLDIACCFKGYKLAEVEDILHAHHGVCMKYGIGVLVDKSLIEIENGWVTLHDLIEDMGKEIVRQESTKEPGKRSRLWFPEDVVEVLEGNTGTSDIGIICMDFLKFEEVVNWDGKAFKKMTNLKTLIIKSGNFSNGPKYLPNSLRVLEWWRYPSGSLPFDFHPKKLVIFKLPDFRFTSLRLPDVQKKLVTLKVLDFGYSNCITEIPDLSGFPNLEKLSFLHCHNLVKVDESVGFLHKLRILNGGSCRNLRSFPPIKLPSLEELHLSGCLNLESFPEVLGKMENIRQVSLRDTYIKELPFSIQNLTGFLRVESELRRTVQLPSIMLSKQDEGEEQVSPVMSSNLYVDLRGCYISDEFLKIGLAWLTNVKVLKLSYNPFTILPACIKELHFLKELSLDYCTHLREIRGIPSNLETFSAIGCTSLEDLDLTLLPACTKECQFLRKLKLTDCENLQEIRGLPLNIGIFEATDCRSLISWFRSKLLNEQLHEEAGNKILVLPGRRIPEWFEHCRRGPSIAFSFRNEFPEISLCVVIASTSFAGGGGGYWIDDFPEVFINGSMVEKEFLKVDEYVSAVTRDHIIIYDLKQIKFKDIADEVLLENEWNHVVFEFDPDVKETGLHVFKSKNSMEDIQFTPPLLLKEKHKVDAGISQIQFLHPQQNFTSLALLEPHVGQCGEGLSLLPLQPLNNNANWDSNSMVSERIGSTPSVQGNTISQIQFLHQQQNLTSLALLEPHVGQCGEGLSLCPPQPFNDDVLLLYVNEGNKK